MNRKNIVYSLIAATGYGSWAFYANQGTGQSLQAFITQGALSFISTLFFLSLILWVVTQRNGKKHQLLTGMAIPNGIVVVILYATHFVAGTPNIVATILPSCIMGMVGSFFYIRGLGGTVD
ncbi:hypothetical protein [Oceanicoccus sp. KOV_DT_Chl]|uniref:hypothetical protein n=1 Tax=Oceanicoccus sp. KOV_DT_Chl TaxID=1904639 RepID=UPI000C7BBE91|nr:hypothetical protein [Oceanicoccus sp. KOV_DT_Chl]